ncbi:hypothetical protein BJP65_00115 [Microbacterium sp. BH-3-3-3]|nr:hypothetical protein BJP65_00115 [Microbacterium sp. BH-3-3-3]
MGDTSHQRASASRLTGAMLHGESTAADYRHDIVCQGCGMKLDRTGSKLTARLDEALAGGEKVLFLDQLQ